MLADKEKFMVMGLNIEKYVADRFM